MLELDKGGFDHSELEALSGHLPKLRRLTLAGGLLGSHLPEWGVLAHPRLQALHLESARAVRLRINAPQLTSLRHALGAGGRAGGGCGAGLPAIAGSH